MPDKKDENPWKIYDHSFDVPDSRMGKGKMDTKKSLELLDNMSKAADSMSKTAYGSVAITPRGMVQESSGKHVDQVRVEEAKKREEGGKMSAGPAKQGPPPIPSDAKSVNKAMTSRSVPRYPRALHDDVAHSGARVLTRGNSRFAKNVHTGPLTAEVIDQVEEDADRRTSQPVYKSCGGCGRRYMIKSQDAECPSCSMNKAMHCPKCHTHLVKSHGGVTCPLCR